jgi:RNA polymerase sigma-70 factor (ECF subfamily)
MDAEGEVELARLMRSAKAGDERAYAEFLRQTSRMVRAFAQRRVGNGATDPEDIVQDTLLAIHMKRHTWRDDAPVTPWIYAIARYKVIDAFRRRGHRPHIPIEVIAETTAQPHTESAMQWEVDRALDSLAPGQRAVVSALSVDGRSVGETAAELSMKETAVRVAFHRGLAVIAAKLGRRS